MAPVDPDLHAFNALPLAFFGTQALLVAALSALVLRTIRSAARTLPPASSTRAQQAGRKYDVAIFSTLAGVSLATLTYCTAMWRRESYLAWAEEGKFEVPGSLWSGWYGEGSEERWWLGSWVKDVGYFEEVAKAGVSGASGAFWADQAVLGLLVGSVFMGVEGRRRNLPWTTTVSFVLLSQICGLSYALNLFFLAMIYTPIPLYSTLPPRRDTLWTPRRAVYRVPLVLSLVGLGFAYQNTDNSLAGIALRVGYFAVPLYLATAIEIVPTSWGIKHRFTATAHRSLLSFFRWASFASPVFYLLDATRCFVNSTPSKHYTGYSYVWNMSQGGVRSPFDRATDAITNLLFSGDLHPALSATRSDVLLAALAMVVWAFLRGPDVNEMLNASFLASTFNTRDKYEKHVAFENELELEPVKVASPATSPAKKRGRPKKNGSVAAPVAPAQSSLRRSSRRKTVSELESDSEDAYKPDTHTRNEIAVTEHDTAENDDLIADGEAAALGLGLFAVGGLGALAAAVLGAEVGGN